MLRIGAGAMGYLGVHGRFGRLAAQTSTVGPDYKAMVCIFLAGGNDTNNLIIPMQTALQGYSQYFAIRGNSLGISQTSLLPIAALNGDQYGLHPQLAPLVPLYNQGDLAVVANVGMLVQPSTASKVRQNAVPVPQNLFSHSDQQQQWQTVQARTIGTTGWGGRAADVLSGLNPAATLPMGMSTSGISLFLNGATTSATELPPSNLSIDGSDGGPRDFAQQQLLTFNSGLSLIQKANSSTLDALALKATLNAALSSGNALATQFPATSLGAQLQQVAQIISMRSSLGMNRQVFYVSLNGFDSHSAQLAIEPILFDRLASAMSAFYNATVELGVSQKVVTFTESEFGRTCQPNSTGGSDHAWGSHHLVMGGPVKKADVFGTFPLLALSGPDDLSGRGIWVPTTSLEQYGATLASWFGVPAASMATVFPNIASFSNRNLGFV